MAEPARKETPKPAILPDLPLAKGRTLTLAGAPDGYDARLLVELAKQRPGGWVHVATDDGRMARLAAGVAFFAPELEVIEFPAWDCLPYDRVSPNPDIIAGRVDALTRLLREPTAPRLVLTTVNAVLQRVPPRARLRQSAFHTKLGDKVDLELLLNYLTENGYARTETVREPGEFAVRGGIVDLFPPSTDAPVRLDMFGDEVEKIRLFDAMTQRTESELKELTLQPAAELFLDPESISRFRTGYRERFGTTVTEDPLYEAVSAGRKHGGMEHWLPLFHAQMETLFDYVGPAPVSLDAQAQESGAARWQQIDEFYQARKELQLVDAKSSGSGYKPLPPDLLYLTSQDWGDALGVRAAVQLAPFGAADTQVDTFDAGARRGRDFGDARALGSGFDAVTDYLKFHAAEGRRGLIAAYSAGSLHRLLSLLGDLGLEKLEPIQDFAHAQALGKNRVGVTVLPVESGFVGPDVVLLTEQDILGERLSRPAKKRRRSDKFVIELASLAPGDFVVHQEHGIGRYDGLEEIAVGGAPHDCVRIIYDGNDKLFVPVENIDVLTRYGSEETVVTLDKLGGAGWQARKAKVQKRLKDMAEALLKIAAVRTLKSTEPLSPPEGLYDEFASRFPYDETEDQLRAIENVVDDLGSGRPMDRLVCGDVGFGKTEVALRAAFVASMAGLQVAVVVPTTLLARQHYQNFTRRFAGLPVRVEQLSRLVTGKEAKAVKEGLADGSVDIVVGTHALLAKTIKFKQLGLLIVDEEQHFGVKQKENLKELADNVHVLTLTATPIPRTLQMALTGVRELSLIATPPVDRLAVRTFVLPYDPMVIREALKREHFRGGQSFYVCPRLEDLPRVELRLKELVPDLKVVTAHGQMSATELEERIGAFYDGKFDILLATNIVESGLDIPSANTLIIHRADIFGLAQLYQLRGRIGRSKLRGYAYLTWNPGKLLTKAAEQRLKVIETLDSLGAGFSLASYDLDIRGAGNLLGEEQSGHIKEVGIELYQQMLEEAVAAAKSGAYTDATELATRWTPQISVGLPVMIPEKYVPDLNVRLSLYRRIAELADRAELDAFAAELVDRFGPMPQEAENLLDTVAIKQLCRQAGIERLDAGPRGAVVTFRDNQFARVDQLMGWVMKQAGTVKIRPDQKLVYTRSGWEDPIKRMKGVTKLGQDLAMLAV
ncbi:transcription-repair coupling factor [Roseiterribacter gracilis]|uniref:Transcription-repair-coupling factor n=1 Tax=Roseiterribacter gracilis TaxID=2812848 RepID=A0A8S8XB12_9PROT|nr:transcription-repair-coupling factor [Rhodospirillales bacterium TMPK1]